MRTPLRDILSGSGIGRKTVDEVVRRIVAHPADFRTLALLTADPDEKTARRAWWVCEKLSYVAPDFFKGKHGELRQQAMTVSDEGARRIILNLLLFLPASSTTGSDAIDVPFLDYCLEHMCAPQRPPAVQAVLMKHAYALCSREPELLQELACLLEYIETDYFTPAVAATVRNLQKTIRKRTKNK